MIGTDEYSIPGSLPSDKQSFMVDDGRQSDGVWQIFDRISHQRLRQNMAPFHSSNEVVRGIANGTSHDASQGSLPNYATYDDHSP